MGFTLLPSLAILCSVAFATPYSAGSGNLIPDGVNTAGSTLLSAGAMLVIGDLSYTVAAALQGVGIPAEADSQCSPPDVQDDILAHAKRDSISDDIDDFKL